MGSIRRIRTQSATEKERKEIAAVTGAGLLVKGEVIGLMIIIKYDDTYFNQV